MTQVYHLILQEPVRAKFGWRCAALDQQGVARLSAWGLSAAHAHRAAKYAMKRYYFG